MKKKLIALLLTALMIVTMLPAVAMAQDGNGGTPPEAADVSLATPDIDLLGKSASDLMTGVAFTKDETEANQFNVTGTLNYIEGYTGFSSNADEQNGYYLAFTLSGAKAEDDITFKGTGEYVALDKSDMTGIVFMGNNAETHKPVSIKINDTTYTLNTDNLTLAAQEAADVSLTTPDIDLLGKSASDLMTGVAFAKDETEANQFNVTGTLNYIEGYTGFSSNADEQNGYYLAFTLSGAKAEDDITFKGTGEYVALDKSDMTGIVFMGNNAETHKPVSIKINDTTYTLNTDGLTLAAPPVKNPLIANQEIHFVDESNYTEEFDPDHNDLPWVETTFVIYKSEIKNPENFHYTVKVENDKISADAKDKTSQVPTGNTYEAGAATFERAFDLTQSQAWNDPSRETVKFTFNAAMGEQVFDGHDDFLGIAKADQQGEYKVTLTAQDGTGEKLTLETVSATYGGSELKPKPADPGKEVEISVPDASTGEQYLSGNGIGDGTSAGAVKAQDVAQLFDNPDGAIVVTDARGNTLDAAATVGTGCVVQLKNGDGVFQEVIVVVKGDVTGRGVVDSTDLMDIVGHIKGTSVLTGAFLKAANTTGSANDAITSADLMDVVALVKANH